MPKVSGSFVNLIIVWAITASLVATAGAVFFPFKEYSATSQVLIISRDRSGVDPYTQAKSAERISENLAKIVGTADFFDKVMASDSQFNRAEWQRLGERDQRKKWQKNVAAEAVYNTSLMNITAFAKSKNEAIELGAAVTKAVATHGWEYVGGDIAIKAVNSPLIRRLPARPSLPMAALGGLAAGILIGWWHAARRRAKIGV